ncbi:LysR family transcriptional regulator [Bradyrhizobium sp. NAS80.1]|uniref:LysR family transcriptional regulator n=1 Tax=Bradyrhizobium sp. NAS80.1 TaxID=1680159 RepID=UPI0009FCEA8C|nr:LysR family transcriptional regulator [Bradyrhizobium sp. NAS80.1]
MDRIAGVTVFVQVADSGSYVAAGKILGHSPSAIGKTIVRLEERLGVRLFHRSTRSLSLTAEGARFLERCRSIMREITDAENDLALSRDTPRGKLKVSLPLVNEVWHRPLLDFTSRFPDIELDLSLTNRNVDLIEEGFDVVLRIGALRDSRLKARRIGSFRLVLVASPAYLAEVEIPRSLDDLDEHACLRSKSASTSKLYPWPLGPNFVHRSDRLRNRLVVDHNAMLISAALDGKGIACVPEFWAKEHVAAGRLQLVLEAETENERVVSAVWPSGCYPPKLKAFVEFIAEALPPVLSRGDGRVNRAEEGAPEAQAAEPPGKKEASTRHPIRPTAHRPRNPVHPSQSRIARHKARGS